MSVLEIQFEECHEFGTATIGHSSSVGQEPKSAFAEIFAMGLGSMEQLKREIESGHRSAPAYLVGRVKRPALASFAKLVAGIEAAFPFEMHSPFEGCDAIAGGVWRGREILSRESDDALVKLRFDEDTCDLPFHMHEHSDRFIVVLEGEGVFHAADAKSRYFPMGGIKPHYVRVGDVVMFTRGLVHTFSAPMSSLTLLSWHIPFIPFDDERQYTVVKASFSPQRLG